MIQDLNNKEDCCGCAACAQVCPKHCITMTQDQEGFLYPVVDKSKCIGCRVCDLICPMIAKKNERYDNPVYDSLIAYAKKDDIRLKSSSGGIFTLLAKCIIAEGGVVFGAVFDQDMMVHHIGISDECEIMRLQGSKYLQSRIENSFKETERLLKNGKKVLYSGTACQIYGLKSFLKREYDNLYTVDVLCHGVPSPKVWGKYIAWQKKKCNENSIENVEFRNKKSGWKNYSIVFQFAGGKEYSQVFTENPYMKLFLADICLRPSCHKCKFKGVDRASDITLGDCWGVENHSPEMDDNRGVSLILLHTKKSKRLIKTIESDLYLKKGEVDKLLLPSAASRYAVKEHINRKMFFKLLNSPIPFECLEYPLCIGKTNKLKWIKNKIINRK